MFCHVYVLCEYNYAEANSIIIIVIIIIIGTVYI